MDESAPSGPGGDLSGDVPGGVGASSGGATREVQAADAGQRLDRWFRRQWPGLPHSRLERLLRTGQIRVDGRRATAGLRLETGQCVRVPPAVLGCGGADFRAPLPGGLPLTAGGARPGGAAVPAVSERDAAALRSWILYDDGLVLVLDKPAGLAVQGGSGTERHLDGLLDALVDATGERPRLVHRLDRDTSGVLVLARSAAMAARLAAAFRVGEVEKTYWAATVGVPQPPTGRIDAPLAKGQMRGGERMTTACEDGKPAVTLYQVLARAGIRAAHVALRPLSGRTHQLRAHMIALGTPILGDGKYGGTGAFLPGLDLPRRLHLHARRLILPHPYAGLIDITAPLPSHMRETWRVLGFDESGDMQETGTPRRG